MAVIVFEGSHGGMARSIIHRLSRGRHNSISEIRASGQVFKGLVRNFISVQVPGFNRSRQGTSELLQPQLLVNGAYTYGKKRTCGVQQGAYTLCPRGSKYEQR